MNDNCIGVLIIGLVALGIFIVILRSAAGYMAATRGVKTLKYLSATLRSQDLIVGNRDFDLKYVVRANPRSLVQILFAPDRRDRMIRSIDRTTELGGPTIDLGSNALTVRARQKLGDAYGLMSMVETAEEILANLVLFPRDSAIPTEGIQIEEVRNSKTGECPVCGTDMDKDQVRCELCRTPHHSECWTYMGRCSTYACSGKRFVA